MNDALSLTTAKLMLREERFQDAIAILERIVNDKSEDSAEAAYCLGIVHHTGSGVPQNADEAANYYLIAEQSRHLMAAFRLGGIYYRRGELQRAYDSFRSAAPSNPSAAYWVYRVLMKDNQLNSDPNAGAIYLNNAAEQGHVVAKRDLAMRYVSGKQGLLKVPYGVLLYAKAVFDIFRIVVFKNERMKYE